MIKSGCSKKGILEFKALYNIKLHNKKHKYFRNLKKVLQYNFHGNYKIFHFGGTGAMAYEVLTWENKNSTVSESDRTLEDYSFYPEIFAVPKNFIDQC